MTKKYSVAEARKLLPQLLHDVEDGQPVEITRRGTPVAVVVSLADFRRLSPSANGFMAGYLTWRQGVGDADLGLPGELLEEVRDRGFGREVDL